MSNAQKILSKIQNDNIQPKPEWIFTSGEWAKRLAYFVFILMGSASFSIILYAISVNGFDLLQHVKHSKLESLLVLLPVFWLGILTFFLGASIFSVLYTGKAYKYSFGKWMTMSTGISLTLGTLFFITGGAKWLENSFETNIESYESLLEKKTAIWSQPDLGTLSGEITEVGSDFIVLKDWKNQHWTIDTKSSFIAPVLEMEPGIQIKLNGQKTGDFGFTAEKIRPWGGAPGKCADEKKIE